MAKEKKVFICDECGHQEPKWTGKCSCGAWNTMVEQVIVSTPKGASVKNISNGAPAKRITEVTGRWNERYPTGVTEFDRVLGGGVVTDSVVLISASPGTGKSTLLLMVSQNLAKQGKKVLYCSGEESEEQIKSRGERLFGSELSENIYLKSTNSMDEVNNEVKLLMPDMLIVDSIQRVALNEFLPSRAGGAVQVTECVNSIINIAKGGVGKNIPVFVVGQVTKDDDLAGVKYLEHAVDVFVFLEGEKNMQLRTMRSIKNRFGSTEEVGLFEMTARGLLSVENPNELFTTKRDNDVIGCALTSVADGGRTFVVEIQSLVTKCVYGMPVRNAMGYNRANLNVLTAMLEARTRSSVSDRDVSVQVTGGLQIRDVAANLGVVMSIVSSHINTPIPQGYVFIGEVCLTGEIANVQFLASRVKAIDRYGYKKVFVPHGALREHIEVDGIEIVEVKTLQDTIEKVFR